MPRLPQPGGDAGNWGAILNDYLSVEHNADGTLKNAARPADLNSKYTKPGSGIPKTDLEQSVQDTLTTVATHTTDIAAKANQTDLTATNTRIDTSLKPDGTLKDGSVTRGALGADVAAALPAASHQVLYSTARRAKGGIVGTDGKSVISFRVDHGLDQFLSAFWPLFVARNMPCSVGIMPDVIDNGMSDPYEPTATTWDILRARYKEGFEIWSHSCTHRDPAITGNSVEYEIAESKRKIEAQGLKVIGFQSPGITPCNTPNYSINFDPATDWTSRVGQLYLANYGLIEASSRSGGSMRQLPTDGCYDLGHFTLDGLTSAQQAKDIVDNVVSLGLSAQFMFHPKFVLNGSVPFTLSMFTTFIDYIKTLRDAGTVEVLTASGLAFADSGSSKRLNILRDSSFESQSGVLTESWTFAAPWKRGTASGVEIKTDGGHTGTHYVHCDAAAGYSYACQDNNQLGNLILKGQAMIVEGWARCTGSNTQARVFIADGVASANYMERLYNLTVAGGWTKIRAPFVVPMAWSDTIQIRVNRGAGTGSVDWDDVVCMPV